MGSLIFAINAVAPIIIMVAIGYFIKKIGLVTVDFAKVDELTDFYLEKILGRAEGQNAGI